MTIHHVWHYAHFDETTTTGTSVGTNTIRSMSSTGFFANPNLINPTEAAPGTVIDGGFIAVLWVATVDASLSSAPIQFGPVRHSFRVAIFADI